MKHLIAKPLLNALRQAGHVSIHISCLVVCTMSLAQTDQGPFNTPLANMRSESPSEASTYENRIVKRRMVHDIDPNVYAYTAAFAKRFQMPEQWIAPDLAGAEAVAFRVMPYYRSCGWGGNPAACKEDETRCMLDVYFDHNTQALPWDSRMRIAEFDRDLTSAGFTPSSANPLARPKAEDGSYHYRSPFTDPQTGKELFWNGGYWHSDVEHGGSFVGIRAYDREIFKGMSLLVLGTACDASAVPQRLWLNNQNLYFKDSHLAQRVVYLSTNWQTRIKELLKSYDQRNRAHFKQVFEDMNKPASITPSPAAK